jgi:hypothetical protein
MKRHHSLSLCLSNNTLLGSIRQRLTAVRWKRPKLRNAGGLFTHTQRVLFNRFQYFVSLLCLFTNAVTSMMVQLHYQDRQP